MRFVFFFFFTASIFAGINEISYAGMTIHCDKGCGEIDDPDFEDIMKLFARAINKNLLNCSVLDEGLEGIWIDPWGEGDRYEWEYSAWDWKVANGFWPIKETNGELIKEPPKRNFKIG